MPRSGRPSPSVSATLFPVGRVETGNDGRSWKVVVNRHGVRRWSPEREKESKVKTQPRRSEKKLVELSALDFYDIPRLRYSSKTVADLNTKQKQRWDDFLHFGKRLQAMSVVVAVVPLAYDERVGAWWVDYPADYVKEMNLNPDDKPLMVVVLKVDDGGRCLPNQPVHIDHSDIKGAIRKEVLEFAASRPWFSWSGRARSAMSLHLS